MKLTFVEICQDLQRQGGIVRVLPNHVDREGFPAPRPGMGLDRGQLCDLRYPLGPSSLQGALHEQPFPDYIDFHLDSQAPWGLGLIPHLLSAIRTTLRRRRTGCDVHVVRWLNPKEP